MESVYGVGVTNRYALFLSEEDPLEKLKSKEKAKEAKKKKQALAEKENNGVKTTVAKDKVVKVANGIKDNQNVKPEAKLNKEDATAAVKPKKQDKVKFNEAKKPTTTGDINETDSIVARKENEFPITHAPAVGDSNRGGELNNTNRRYNNGGSEARPYRNNGEYREYREPREPRAPGEEGGESRYNRGGGQFGGPRPPRGARGGGRGGRGGGSGEYRGKREFDRQSGSDKTGIKPQTKRNGAGPHNWGSERDEIDEHMSGGATPAAGNGSDPLLDWGDGGAQVNDSLASNADNASNADKKENGFPASTTEPTEPAVEEPKEITLDEWKASRGIKLLKPTYKLRKAGEGEDLTQWKGMYELKKKKEEADQLNEEEKVIETAAKTPKKKEIVDTNFHFADQPTRGGRGKGRGGPRGARRGGDRGERGERGFRGGSGGSDRGSRGDKTNFPRPSRNVPRVDVTNEHDFPSLG